MSFLLLFILFVSSFLNTFVKSTQHLCHPDQRDALLEFKNEFKIQKPAFVDSEVSSYPKTDSWVNKSSDCCSWDGITCEAMSGEVIGIDLSFSCLHGRLESNSSLFRLSHVRDLNLAYNNFNDSSIPIEFGKLEEIQRLNLSKSSFSGQIPTNLLQLTKLVSLDLSLSHQNSLSVDESFLSLLSQNLRNLRELDLSFVNISSEIPQEFSNMWSLRLLHLVGCNLFGEFPSSVLLLPNLESVRLSTNPKLRGKFPDFHGKTNNSMQILSLSQTSFYGIIPESIRNLKHLRSLILFESNFSGKIPISLGNLSHLSFLSLAYNNLNGEIPSSIGNLNQLTDLDVRNNKLNGNLPSSLVNMTKLRYINLCFNQFTGFLPSNISQLSKLEEFYACENSFVGAIPSSLYSIPSLTTIYLNDNQFTNLVGFENISMLLNLRYLFLNDNNFNLMVTPVDLNVFLPLKQLQILSLSGIPLSATNITYDSSFLSNLVNLKLSGCNISEFPEFIKNQRNLISLNLSNNKIKGKVPDWLWRLKDLIVLDLSSNSFTGFSKGSVEASHESKIYLLDLSSNAFQGPIFMPSTFVHYFFASKNNFTGEIAGSICGLISPDILDLSNNNLHGSIPRCLETQMTSLSDLNLANNRLSGSLPDIFINAKSLKSLDVSHNQLEGQLPASLTGCSALEVLNVGSNRINDIFPFKLNSLQKLQVLVLRSNKFHGMLHQSDSVWSGFPQLKIIDVSHNNFRGVLPSDYFLNWTAMTSTSNDNMIEPDYIRGLYGYYTSLVLMSKGVSMVMERILTIYTAIDFSGNQLHGKIPGSIGLLKELRILNISSNAFIGNIPSSLANLTNLESLDLSENRLTGEIPPELGTLSSLSWINISHNQLVGSIPQGTQFQRQDCSSYLGNLGLYVPSLKDVCRDIYSAIPPQPEPVGIEEKDEESLSWIAAGIGFAPGVIFGLTMGYIVASCKHEWFMKTFVRSKHW